MASNEFYWWEKITVAVQELMTGDHPLKARLENAWSSGLGRLRMHDSVRAQFNDKFLVVEAKYLGAGKTPISDQISALSASESRELSLEILQLYNVVQEAMDQGA